MTDFSGPGAAERAQVLAAEHRELRAEMKTRGLR